MPSALKTEKPNWHKGDVIRYAEGTGNGRALFFAELEPERDSFNGYWVYGFTPCNMFQKATLADADRYAQILADEQNRLDERKSKLMRLRAALKA